MLIFIENLNKSFGGNLILKDINLTVEANRRYGLIGVNGAGKSTLLSIIMDELEYESGRVNRAPDLTVGYLKQNSGLVKGLNILEEMRSVFSDILNAEKSMRKLEKRLSEISDHASDEYRAAAAEYSKVQGYFDSRDGYNIDVKIKMILNGMGFSDKSLDTKTDTLSGGEKTRLAIAKLLLEEPDLLILDEPTNHLDFKTLRWLETYLLSYKGAVLIVSHDRYFLDKTVDEIFELQFGKLVNYKGNYSKYLILKKERLERMTKEYEAQQLQIAEMQDYADRNIARASTSASAKSRLKAIENMELISKPDSGPKTIKLKFESHGRPYNEVLTVENLDICVGAEKRKIVSGVNLSVKRGEKVAIIGDNGIGKSSFLKAVLGVIPAAEDCIEWGKNTEVSYYDQENSNMDFNKLALDELWDRFPEMTEAQVRKVLGNVLLTKEDVYKPVSVISGGERARLGLCILMLEKANVMLMDEPTNHLDLPSKEVLEKALSEYDGTLIFISHDRYLLNRIPDKIVEMTFNGVNVYSGKFDDYAAKTEEQPRVKSEREAETKIECKNKNDKNFSHRTKEQRRIEAERKQRIRFLEQEIERLENENSALEAELALEEVYTDYKLMHEKTARLDLNTKVLEEHYYEWEQLQEN